MRWTFTEFGSEQLITFVAMATPDDLNANAEFIRLADSFVEVPSGKLGWPRHREGFVAARVSSL